MNHKIELHLDVAENAKISESDFIAATPGSSPTTAMTLPQRKNIRAKFHDYTEGDYFITICTYNKKHYFGTIKDDKMVFSKLGQYAHDTLRSLSFHYKNFVVDIPQFVVMPNHIHAVICIRRSSNVGLHPDAAEDVIANNLETTKRSPLGIVIGGYKQNITRFAQRNKLEFSWQSRFHDHIIRNNNDRSKISDYILNNVVRWSTDCYCENNNFKN